MHETPVKIKDVKFVSYLRPSKLHGHVAVLHLSFRLPHMQEDQMIIDIQRDEENCLYTTNVDYYCETDEQPFSLAGQLDLEELHELLKAVLNSEAAKKELRYCEMSDYVNCYAKPITYDFEVMVTNSYLSEGERTIPAEVYRKFHTKTQALQFFQKIIEIYKEKSIELMRQGFGAYKTVWKHEQTNKDILTYILLTHQGVEITTLEAYNAL